MARNQDGHKPDQPNRRDETIQFGSPDNRRRRLWAIIRALSEKNGGGADWNDVLDEAEERGIDRSWAHEEIKRRLRWEDIHLFDGDLYPHYKRRSHVELWYQAMRPESRNTDFTDLNTCLDDRGAVQRSLWRILNSHSGRRGARTDEVIDTAEQYGMDPFWVHEMLVFWNRRGDIKLSQASNRVELKQEDSTQ